MAIGIDELAIYGVVCTFGKTYCPNGDDVVILEEKHGPFVNVALMVF